MTDRVRGFSLRTATFVVVSSTVGGGVLSTSGYVALDVRSNGLMLVLWVVGGLIAACGALAMAEVSAALPRSGGEFVILSETYGPLVGFLGGWVSLLFGFIAPIAATGSAAAAYLLSPWSLSTSWTNSLATLAILALGGAHAAGRSRTERVQFLATAATIAVLAAFIVLGLVRGWPNRGALLDFPSLAKLPTSSMFVGLIFVSYCYTGWNGASYVAGDIEDPQRSLPRAIVFGTAIVIALYCGLNAVFALALPVSDLETLVREHGRDAVKPIAALAARPLFGGASVVAASLGVVLLAALSAMILTGPRVAFAMAREGRLPAILGRLTTHGQSPAMATGFVSLGAIALLWSGRFEQIVFASGVGLALNSLLTVGAVYVLRWRKPTLHRPFRVPGYPLVPAVYLALTVASLVFAFLDPDQQVASLAGLAGVLSAIPVYAITILKPHWFGRSRGMADHPS